MKLWETIKARLILPTPKFFKRLFNTILATVSGVIALCIAGLAYEEYILPEFAGLLRYTISGCLGVIIAAYIISKLPVEWARVSDEKLDEVKLPEISNLSKEEVEQKLSQ